jgi:hypothetical protein
MTQVVEWKEGQVDNTKGEYLINQHRNKTGGVAQEVGACLTSMNQ